MLPRRPSCWLRSSPLMRSLSFRSSLRPALPCCSATDSPASCTTTVTGALLTPLGVSKAPVTVVVQLAGESVAEQQGNAGRKLDRNERERIKGELRNQQEGLRGSIESLGGSVVAHYQGAYNGIKVRIAADRAKE